MKCAVAMIFGLFLVLSGVGVSMAGDPDVKGSKDHPLLSRMPDFHITGYKYNDFDSYKFNAEGKKRVDVEGHKYYTEYKLDKGAVEPGELKIRRNIQDALKKIGGNVVFDDNFNKCSTIVLQKDGKETWIEVKSYNSMYRLTTVEKETMKQEVVATAEKMGNDIHGSFDSNMKLSRDRAEAVTKQLTGKHQIAADRLKPHGVSSLAPVASNDTEDGKQKNRRVELVKQ
jgi:OOP family OmpA-OmpF porin